MPQIPLFVSSAKANDTSTGSFSVDFQPPLELPESAKNATIEVTQMTVPYTTPNIDSTNNKLVVNLPNVSRTGITKVPGGGATNQRFVLTIPPALYSLESLQDAINTQVNRTSEGMGGHAFSMRPTAVTHKTLNADGTDGPDIQQDPIPNFLEFRPDYATNRLHIKLNYTHSGLLFSDAESTIASTLGFTDDMLTTTERYVGLETTSITVDILWRSKVADPWQQFAATLPAQPSRGYTATQIKNDLNTIVEDYLYQNHQVGPATSPWNAMISSMQVFPGTEPHTYQIKTDYTDETLVKVRGDMYDSTDLSGLPAGQLRSGLPNPAYAGPPLGNDDRWAFIGNPYASHTGYVAALMHPIANAAVSGVTSAGPTIQEIQTAMFITSCGLVGQGVRGGNFDDVDSTFGSGLTFFQNTSNLHDATAKTAAHIDAVTEIGLAVEPIVQGPRDTSGKTSGTLARFSIPKGTQPGDIIPFEAAVPTKVSVQQFVGSEINKLTFRLVDQNNDAITDLAGEHFSAVVVFSFDN